MNVILLKELKGKGGEGDIVEVAKGYANNYLFINGIAVPATPGNIKQLEQRKVNIGVVAGYGYGFTSRQVEPFVGLGVSVNFW